MDKYKQLIHNISTTFPLADKVEIHIYGSRNSGLDFQLALVEHLKSYSIDVPNDLIVKQWDDKSLCDIAIPLVSGKIGYIKLHLDEYVEKDIIHSLK